MRVAAIGTTPRAVPAIDGRRAKSLQSWRTLALQFPELRIEHLALIPPPCRGLVLAIADEVLPQIRQRHIAAVLVDELVDAESAMPRTFATPYLKQTEPTAYVVQRRLD